MDWADEPATEKQLLRLKGLGFVPTRPLMMTEAARLIRQYHKSPPPPPTAAASLRPSPPPARSPAGPAERPDSRPRQLDISESVRMHVYRLHKELDEAKVALAANPTGPNTRADFAARLISRREFWMDTCRDPKEMLLGSVQVFELYQNYGSAFFTPTGEQVQQIFDALDTVMPSWDKDHPELFYQTLELNFAGAARRA